MGDQVVYRGGLGAGTFTCVLSVGLLGMGVFGLTDERSPLIAVALPFVMAACFAYVGVRQFRVRLVVTDDEVELRGAVRTKTLARSQVVDVEVGLFLKYPALFVVDSGRSRWMVPQELRMGPAWSLEQRRAALLADLTDPSHPPAPKPPAVPWNTEAHLVGADEMSTTVYDTVNLFVRWSRMVQAGYARRSVPTSLRPDWMPSESPDDAPADPPWLMPVNVSPWAMAAGYLGLTCILVLPAPLALVTGFIGLWDVERHPGRRGRARAWFGIGMAILAPATWFVVAQLATRY